MIFEKFCELLFKNELKFRKNVKLFVPFDSLKASSGAWEGVPGGGSPPGRRRNFFQIYKGKYTKHLLFKVILIKIRPKFC